MKIEIGHNEANQRLDKFLRKLLKDVPLSAIFKELRKGNIKVNDKKGKQDYRIQEGDIITIKDINTKNNIQEKLNRFIELDSSSLKITYEDENILILEKWPGVLVHAGNNKDKEPTLTDYTLSYLYNKGQYDPKDEITFSPSPCNRLDRNTSGIVIFGKNFEALKCLNQMIRERNIEKYYISLVKGKIKEGRYEAYISKDNLNNISQVSYNKKENSKKIAMDVKVIRTVGSYSLIEINLITGKSHQLRAHLSFLGNPIIGDPKYGDKKLNSFFENKYGLNYQFLYAYKVIFKKCNNTLEYMENKTIAESLPPIFKKIKNDVLKF